MAVILALCAPAFIGTIGLSVETGYWYYLQDRAQSAADVSAFAGATALQRGDPQHEARQEAYLEAAFLGYTAPDEKVTVNIPPASGNFHGGSAVEVIIEYSPERFFSSIFTNEPLRHTVRGVASLSAESRACILALNPSASRALTISGNGTLHLDGCEVMANSVSSSALYIGGSADLKAECASASGGAELSGASLSVALDCGAPRTKRPPAADPYASVAEPNGLYVCEPHPSKGGGPNAGIQTIDPGHDKVARYCGDLTLQRRIHFEPGLYIIDGGRFSIDSLAHVTGSDVTFFLTSGSEIAWNGGARIELAAPNSGLYKGLLVFGDRQDSFATHKINGNVASSLTGAIYTPASDVEFLGNFSGAGGCMQLVADEIVFRGSSDISKDCNHTGIEWADLSGRASLVE